MTLAASLLPLVLQACSSTPGPDVTIGRYLSAWAHGNYGAMAALVAAPPKTFVSFNQKIAAGLDLERARYSAGTATINGSTASAPVTSRLLLTPFGPLELHTTLRLTESNDVWRVLWSPRSIISSLGPGDSVSTSVSWPVRADILGAGGAPLVGEAPMVTVGIEGNRITSPPTLTTILEQAGATAAQVTGALATATAHPSWFVPVFDLTAARYAQLKSAIYPVPGTVFQMFSARTAVTPGLTAHVVGAVGSITAQELQDLGAPYQDGDTVGQSGIEQAYERQLAGRPGGQVRIMNASGVALSTLASFTGHKGSPVRTTIDPTIQADAEAALAGVTRPAALVALQPSTGDVLASVSLPDSDAFDNALAGSFPPGSTFKVVTSADLIEHGSSPASRASCPPTITVDGEVFHNFEGETQASLSLEQAFAESCNAAFIGLAGALPYPSFTTTAAQFGIGGIIQMGVPAFGGKVPTPTSDAQRAATAIGQAAVLVSPLDMAGAAAAVASGSFRPPRLVTGTADDSAPARALDSPVVTDLRTMMQAVVDSPEGTAAGAGLPPGTFGKTGTAEFGTATPPQTHAWFIGFRGNIAFAVLVVGGGIGGAVAAPIAARFLDAVGSS